MKINTLLLIFSILFYGSNIAWIILNSFVYKNYKKRLKLLNALIQQYNEIKRNTERAEKAKN